MRLLATFFAMAASILSILFPLPVTAAEQTPDFTGKEDLRQRRLLSLQTDIERLQAELKNLTSREKGVLGEIERLGAEIRLREVQKREAELRLAEVAAGIVESRDLIGNLHLSIETKKRYLSFRLREMYKLGPGLALRRSLGGDDVEEFLSGLRYAAFLSEKDAEVLASYREEVTRMEMERAALVAQKEELENTRMEALRAERSLNRSRQVRKEVLEEVRRDKAKRKTALQELESAASELNDLIDKIDPNVTGPVVNMNKFKGLLDIPVKGKLIAGFGSIVHPRFKTVVPHPGLDIEAAEGSSFHAIFEGRVVYAAWLRGYGLTVIIDHGAEMASVYAHASVLLVQEGDQVVRGQRLGLVGSTGSLKGVFLYFELRSGGKPLDPEPWFRKR